MNLKKRNKEVTDSGEHPHYKITESYLNDKMRLCLLNLFLLFIEKFEITEYAGIFNGHVASSHPVNLLFCHLSSNEIQLKLSKVNHILKVK